jgi:hypothetical protein
LVKNIREVNSKIVPFTLVTGPITNQSTKVRHSWTTVKWARKKAPARSFPFRVNRRRIRSTPVKERSVSAMVRKNAKTPMIRI